MKAILILATLVSLTSCAEYPGSIAVDTPWFSSSKDSLGNISVTPKITTIVIPAK